MSYDVLKKKMSFRILASIMLLAMLGFLFVPSVMLTTKTTQNGSTSIVATTFSGFDVLQGAFFSDKTESIESVTDGARGVVFFKTTGQEKGLSSSAFTNAFASMLVISVICAGIAGIMNLFTITKRWPKYEKYNYPISMVLIVLSMACAIIAFILSFFWVSGGYSNGLMGDSLIRTSMQSFGYIGMIGQVILPSLAFVFYHDRKVKE